MKLGKSRAKNTDRVKARIWTPTSTSDIDGTISQAAISIFHCIPTLEERERTLAMLNEAVTIGRKMAPFSMAREDASGHSAWVIVYTQEDGTQRRSPGLYVSVQEMREDALKLADDLETLKTWPVYQAKE